MAKITLAQLTEQLQHANDEIAQLEQQLAVALARLEELESQAPRRDQLEQSLWLQRTAPDERWRGVTQNGTPYIKFSGQHARLDKASGRRDYGAYKDLVAYGEIAEQVSEIFDGQDRLVMVRAYERPWSNRGQERRSDWVVTHVSLISNGTQQPAAQTPAEAPAEEECLPF